VNFESEWNRAPGGGVFTWILVWSFASTAMIIGMVTGGDYDSSNLVLSLAMGMALGLLSAAWTGWGVWAFVIDHTYRPYTKLGRLWIHGGVALLWIANLSCLLFFAGQSVPNLGLAITLSAVSFAGALLIRVLMKRQISREWIGGNLQTSISQLFVLTTIIAVLLAIINFIFRYFNLLTELTVIVMLHSAIWVFCVVFLLGRRWWAYSLCVFLQVVLMIGMTGYIENSIRDLTFQTQLQSNGMLASAFGLSTLFILLLRSSGYRWFMPKLSDPQIPSAS
jgi:hypothetical protein